MIKKLPLITFSILFIVSCGGGGGGGGGEGPSTPATPAPTVNLSAEPTSVLIENTSTLTWSSTNATSCSAGWTSQTATSGSEAVTITSVGNNSFSITCTGAGGSRSASVTVEGYRNTDGVVVDGYISGAEVCIDEDESWTCDSDENSTTSDNEGKFTIRYANGSLVSIGGTDLDSQTLLDNLLITHKLSGHSEFKAVTPVTSVAAFMENASLVNTALGIDASIDVFTFDPVANKGDSGINDYLYEKGNQLTVLAFALQNITNNLNTTTQTTQDFFKAIAEEIEKEYTETQTKVDIETESFITIALNNIIAAKSVTIDETAKANVTKALSEMLPIIQVKSSDDLTTSVIRFAVSTFQTDIKAIANGTATAETITSYTEDLLNYIAADQNIDAGEIEPDINTVADSVSTPEDTEVEINVLLNDSYFTSSPFSLSATNGTNGSTSIANNLITYSPDADYNGSDSFSYTLTQGSKTSSANVVIAIEAVNDAPSIDVALTIQVEENQTDVTTISVSDIDEDELTLTLGGTDADSFNLSTENVLTFKEAPDYETKDSYAITLSLTDGIETVTKDISIIILDVNYVFSGKVIDGYIDGAEIFIDQNFNFTKDDGEFSATSDSDGAFNIDISDESLAACLQKRPIIAEVPVGAIDSTLGEVLSAYQMILPSIEDSIAANDAIYITPFTSLLSDAVIQGVNASNIVDEIDVSQGCGDIANSVAINISNELIQITNSIESSLDISFKDLLIDFIQDNSSSIITETSAQRIAAFFPYFKELSDEFDAELSNIHGEIINTNVIIEEDAISSILSSSDIEEMPLSFNAIYKTDPNELGWFIQEKIVANGAKVNSDGQIKHHTCFTSSENCITDTRNLDALRNASKRYTRTSTFLNNNYDPQNYNYQLVIEDEQRVDFDIDGNPKDRVCIYQNWLYLTPVNTRENFVTNDRYNTGASDGSNNNDDCSDVLANKNEALFVALVDEFDDGVDFEEIDIRITNPIYQNSTFFENKVNNIYQNRDNLDLDPLIQEIASVPRTLKDIENLRAKLTESSTDQISIYWTKRNATGQQLESAKIDIKFDKNKDYFEYGTIENSSTGSEYTVVSSTEGQQAINDIVEILYSNSNVFNSADYLSYAPIFTSEPIFTVDENQIDIGTVAAVDGDDDVITFTISGNEISISSEGALTFNTAPDYETKTSYTATVTASDGTNSTTQEITVNINDVPEQTIQVSVEANNNGSGNVYVINGTQRPNLELAKGITYTFVHPAAHPFRFSTTADGTHGGGVEYTTGVNTGSSGTTIIKVTDSTPEGLYYYCSVHSGMGNGVSLTNNAPPEFTSSATFSVDENQTSIGTVTATDAEGDAITFSISGSDIGITSTGVLSFITAPDYETKSSYSATITANDGNSSSTQDITVNINNLNDNNPSFTSNATFSANENQTAIGTVTATDADGDILTFNVSGSELEITSAGILTFASAPDYETKTSYTATVSVSDGTNSTTQDITVNVTNVNDIAPVFTSDATFSAEENQTAIGTVTATDAEGDDVTFTVSGSELEITSAGILTFASAPDYETKTSYTATVSASDGTNSTTQDITVNITNVNDNSPAFTSNATFSAEENQTAIGTVVASDADGDGVTYSISGSDITINASSGVIAFASAPDYETTTSYTATVTASDGTNSTTQDITVNITNVNDNSPAFTSNATFSAEENQTAIGTVVASDADGDGVTYSISGSDITINASSGVIAFASAPDYETTTSYTATVTASDGSNSTNQEITVNVTDVLDTFKISGTAYTSRYMVLDSDVPNTTNHTSNGNQYGNAQVIQNPVTIVGHTGNDTDRDNNNTTDVYDLFEINLTNNMYVRLEVSEFESGVNDLDLMLYNVDGTEYTDWAYASGSTEDDETINLPSSGTILIQVLPVAGSSRYKLTVAQRVIPSSSGENYKYQHTFRPNELIISNISNNYNDEEELQRNRLKLDPEVDAEKAPISVEKNFGEENLLKFDILKAKNIQGIKDIDTKDENLLISDKQKNYLYHWKLQQRLKSKFPLLDFGFNYNVYSFANFSADPDYWVQWHFPAISAEAGLNAVGQETKNIVVAVLDSGSPPTDSSAWAATDFISGGIDFISSDTDPTDPDSYALYNDPETGRIVRSHGVHVASTIGSKNDGNYINGFGIKVIPIKVLGDTVVGKGGTLNALINGINYAAGLLPVNGQTIPTSEGPVKVINMSLGAEATSCPSSLQTAINDAVNQGITVVAAAGNSALKNAGGSNWPALCDNVISVANVTENLTRRADSDFNSTVDIAAPGDVIYAWDRSERIEQMGGTSMAAPIVSGVIANMYSLDLSLTPSEINSYIVNGSFTYDLGTTGRDNEYGYGLINFAKSANSVITQEGLTKTYAYVNPGIIDYGFDTTSIDVVLNKVGSGSLSVSNLAADNATGLTYASNVDANGYGTYTLNFDRSSYPNGLFENKIYFNMSDGTSPTIAMRYAKGSQPNRANIGKVYIGLYNSSNDVVASGYLELDGSLAFETTGRVPIGDYYYIISTDIDNDGYICTSGEICEIYPLSDSSELYISVTDSDVTGDAVTLRAISSGTSSLSSFSSEEFNNKNIYQSLSSPFGVSASKKPDENKVLYEFKGIPVNQK